MNSNEAPTSKGRQGPRTTERVPLLPSKDPGVLDAIAKADPATARLLRAEARKADAAVLAREGKS